MLGRRELSQGRPKRAAESGHRVTGGLRTTRLPPTSSSDRRAPSLPSTCLFSTPLPANSAVGGKKRTGRAAGERRSRSHTILKNGRLDVRTRPGRRDAGVSASNCFTLRVFARVFLSGCLGNAHKHGRPATPAPAAEGSSPRAAATELWRYRRNAACKHVRFGGEGAPRLGAAAHASTSPRRPALSSSRRQRRPEDAPFKTMTQGRRGNGRAGAPLRKEERKGEEEEARVWERKLPTTQAAFCCTLAVAALCKWRLLNLVASCLICRCKEESSLWL